MPVLSVLAITFHCEHSDNDDFCDDLAPDTPADDFVAGLDMRSLAKRAHAAIPTLKIASFGIYPAHSESYWMDKGGPTAIPPRDFCFLDKAFDDMIQSFVESTPRIHRPNPSSLLIRTIQILTR